MIEIPGGLAVVAIIWAVIGVRRFRAKRRHALHERLYRDLRELLRRRLSMKERTA